MSASINLHVTLEYARWRGHVTVAPEEQPTFYRWIHGVDVDYWEHEGVVYYRTGLERVQIQKPRTVEDAYLDAVAKGQQDPNDKDAQAAFIAQWHTQQGEAAQ